MAFSPTARAVAGLGLLAVLLCLLPLTLGKFTAYQIGTYLLYGVAAQGVALTWGRTGFLPLGQALFFGLGAYIGGLLLIRSTESGAWLSLAPLVAIVPAALAFVIARTIFHRQYVSGANFSLITMALVILATQLANRWEGITGGFNGLTNIPDLPGLGRYGALYWLIAGYALACTALMVWLYRTPFGTLLAAISQNESRMQFLGYSTPSLKATAFAISAAVTGGAGFLYAAQQGIVSPTVIGFQLSAELIIWTAVGGRFGPFGALFGAVAVGWASAEIREVWDKWEVVVATAFILIVIFLPGGLASLGQRLLSRWLSAKPVAVTAVPAPLLSYPAAPLALEFRDVTVRIGEVGILNGLSLQVSQPGIHCLIGPNGAGKTSALNALTGRLPVTGGEIRIEGQRVNGAEAHAVARMGVGRKLQIPSVFRDLTVAQNLSIAQWAMRMGPRDSLRNATWGWRSPRWQALEARFSFLVTEADKPAGLLSQGQRQMLELAMTFLTEPRLLLLDEPCAGLSTAETAEQVAAIVEEVRQSGTIAIVIEHDMAAVERMSDHLLVLHQGRLLYAGDLPGAKASAEVQSVYAGGRK